MPRFASFYKEKKENILNKCNGNFLPNSTRGLTSPYLPITT
uniref:Uncharacterized protein n=1 Tax=Zea mays TaxID=4577 RepID=C0PB85_MAIZE|nr:unknown [Zea mays]